MDMTLIRLTPPGDAVRSSQSPNSSPDPSPTSTQSSNNLPPEIVADILWAVASPANALEHIRAKHGNGRQIDIAIFQRNDPDPGHPEDGLALCRRAIATAPALAGWTAQLLNPAHRYPAG